MCNSAIRRVIFASVMSSSVGNHAGGGPCVVRSKSAYTVSYSNWWRTKRVLWCEDVARNFAPAGCWGLCWQYPIDGFGYLQRLCFFQSTSDELFNSQHEIGFPFLDGMSDLKGIIGARFLMPYHSGANARSRLTTFTTSSATISTSSAVL